METRLQTLPNGLKTLFVDLPGTTAATVQIWFRAGSALEREGDEGIAHFLEHMFFKGTPLRPGSSLAHEVESYGGEVNAFTSFDYTCYYINSPSSKIEKSCEILLDMVSNPLFPEDDLIPERNVVFEEYRRSQDNPNQYSFQKIQSQAFTGTYAHPILGNEKTIKSFSKKQLLQFRKDHYCKENALFVVAGDLKKSPEITTLIERYELPSGEKSKFPEFELKKESSVEAYHKDIRMAQLSMIIPAPYFESQEAAAEDLALNGLGHGESSRLNKFLVEEAGVANDAHASSMFMNKGGIHFFKVVCPTKNLTKMTQKFYSVFESLYTKGFEQWELDKIKNQYVASKVYDRESAESYASSLGHGFAQNEDIYCEDHFIENIKKCSLESVNQAFRNLLQKPIHISLQLPKSDNIAAAQKEANELLKNLNKLAKKKLPATKGKVETSPHDSEVKLIELDKGVSLLYRYNNMTPTFVFHSYIQGGITEESLKTNGIYHLLTAVLTKGNSKMSEGDIKKIMDDRSASFHTFCGKNAYGVTLHAQSVHFTELLDIFMNTLFKPTIPEQAFKRERELSLRQLEAQKEDPIKQCFLLFTKLLFGTHPYSLNTMGDAKAIKAMTASRLQKLHKDNLFKKGVLFTYCGDLDIDSVVALVKERIGNLPARAPQKYSPAKIIESKESKQTLYFDREQTQIMTGLRTAHLTSQENIILKILTTHMSGQSSELFVEVRDKQGLCYSAQPVHFQALETGYWGIYMASGHDKVDRALNAIHGILTRLKENGLSEEEYTRTKGMIEGQTQTNVQTNEDYANIYSVPILQGLGLNYYHNNKIAIQELSYEDFQKGIKKILSRKFKTVVVGR